jgi:hypothetical protein
MRLLLEVASNVLGKFGFMLNSHKYHLQAVLCVLPAVVAHGAFDAFEIFVLIPFALGL